MWLGERGQSRGVLKPVEVLSPYCRFKRHNMFQGLWGKCSASHFIHGCFRVFDLNQLTILKCQTNLFTGFPSK